MKAQEMGAGNSCQSFFSAISMFLFTNLLTSWEMYAKCSRVVCFRIVKLTASREGVSLLKSYSS
jgi:hypothetical protein